MLYMIGVNKNGLYFFEKDEDFDGNKYSFVTDILGEEHIVYIGREKLRKFLIGFDIFNYAVVSEKSLEEAKKIWNESLNKLVEQHMKEVHKYESLFIKSDEEFLDELIKAMEKMSSKKMKKVKDIVNKATESLEP